MAFSSGSFQAASLTRVGIVEQLISGGEPEIQRACGKHTTNQVLVAASSGKALQYKVDQATQFRRE